jgi:hypothetical protein
MVFNATFNDILAISRPCGQFFCVFFLVEETGNVTQALVSFKKYMPPPLPYFKVNICPLPLPHFASIFFAYL